MALGGEVLSFLVFFHDFSLICRAFKGEGEV